MYGVHMETTTATETNVTVTYRAAIVRQYSTTYNATRVTIEDAFADRDRLATSGDLPDADHVIVVKTETVTTVSEVQRPE